MADEEILDSSSQEPEETDQETTPQVEEAPTSLTQREQSAVSGSVSESQPISHSQDPGLWSQVTSRPWFDKLSNEQKSAVLDKFTAAKVQYASSLPGYDKNTYKSLMEASSKLRDQYGPTKMEQAGEFLGHVAKGIIGGLGGAASGAAETVLSTQTFPVQKAAEAIGLDTSNAPRFDFKTVRSLPLKAEEYARGFSQFLDVEGKSKFDSALDDLKNSILDGTLTDEKRDKINQQLVSANQSISGDDARLYQNPMYDLKSPANMEALNSFALTGNPAYLKLVQSRFSTSPKDIQIQQEYEKILGSREGYQDYYKKVLKQNGVKDDSWTAWTARQVGEVADLATETQGDPFSYLFLTPAGPTGTAITKTIGRDVAVGTLQAVGQEPLASGEDLLKQGATLGLIGLGMHGLAKLTADKADLIAQKNALPNDPSVAATTQAVRENIDKQLDDINSKIADTNNLPNVDELPGEVLDPVMKRAADLQSQGLPFDQAFKRAYAEGLVKNRVSFEDYNPDMQKKILNFADNLRKQDPSFSYGESVNQAMLEVDSRFGGWDRDADNLLKDVTAKSPDLSKVEEPGKESGQEFENLNSQEQQDILATARQLQTSGVSFTDAFRAAVEAKRDGKISAGEALNRIQKEAPNIWLRNLRGKLAGQESPMGTTPRAMTPQQEIALRIRALKGESVGDQLVAAAEGKQEIVNKQNTPESAPVESLDINNLPQEDFDALMDEAYRQSQDNPDADFEDILNSVGKSKKAGVAPVTDLLPDFTDAEKDQVKVFAESNFIGGMKGKEAVDAAKEKVLGLRQAESELPKLGQEESKRSGTASTEVDQTRSEVSTSPEIEAGKDSLGKEVLENQIRYDLPDHRVNDLLDILDNVKTKEGLDSFRKTLDEEIRPRQEAEAASLKGKQAEEPRTQVREASGKQIELFENSDKYIEGLKTLEEKASSEKMDDVTKRTTEVESQFSGEDAIKSVESKLADPLKQYASDILAAARNKYRKQVLQNAIGKKISPKLIIDSTVKDFLDKAKSRSDIKIDSLAKPIGEEGGSTLGEAIPGQEALPTEKAASADTIKATEEAVKSTQLDPQEKAVVQAMAADETVKFPLSKSLQSALAKLRQALKDKGIPDDEVRDGLGKIINGEVKVGVSKEGISNENATTSNLPSEQNAGQRVQEQTQVLKPQLEKRFTPEDWARENSNWKRLTTPLPQGLKSALDSSRETLHRLGLSSQDILINQGLGDKRLMSISFSQDGSAKININLGAHKELAKLGYITDKTWFDTMLHEEMNHRALGNIISELGVENGAKTFDEAAQLVSGALGAELKTLVVDTRTGLTFYDAVKKIYGPEIEADPFNFAVEGIRMIMDARDRSFITEQLFKPKAFQFIRRIVEKLKSLFTSLPEDSFTKAVIDRADELLGNKPVVELPLRNVELSEAIPNNRSVTVGVANPDFLPLKEFTESLKDNEKYKATLKSSSDFGEFWSRLKENLVDKMIDTKDDLSSSRLSMGAVKDAYLDWINAPGKFTGYKKAVNNWTAAGQVSNFHLRHFQDSIKKIAPSSEGRRALTFYKYVDGDLSLLKRWNEEIQNNPEATREAKRLYRNAMKWVDKPEFQQVGKEMAPDLANLMDSDLQRGLENGIFKDGQAISNYLTSVVKPGKKSDKVFQQISGEMSGGKFQKNFQFAKQRFYRTFHDAMMAGCKPGELDIAEVIGKYDGGLSNTIRGRELVYNFSTAKASDGRPIVAPLGFGPRVAADGENPKLFIRSIPNLDKAGYTFYDHPLFKKHKVINVDENGRLYVSEAQLGIHPEHINDIKNLLGKSWFDKSYGTIPIVNLPFKPAYPAKWLRAQVKSHMLLLPTFHYGQIALHGGTSGTDISRPFRLGERFEINKGETQALMEHGAIYQAYDQMQTFMEGVIGSKPVVAVLASKIPVLGKPIQAILNSSNFLFQEYIPWLKQKIDLQNLEETKKRYAKELADGKVTMDDIYYQVSKEGNDMLAYLNYADMGRNPTMQDIFAFGILAPAWTEGRVRASLRSLGSLSAVPLQGSLGKAGAHSAYTIGMIAVVGALTAQTFNQIANGEQDWKHPFTWHVGKTNFRPKYLPGDILEAASGILPYFDNESGKFARNRLSPMAQFAWDYANETDYAGRPMSRKDIVYNQLFAGLPLGPIRDQIQNSLPPELRPKNYSERTLQQSIFGSFGVNVNDNRAQVELNKEAAKFKAENNIQTDRNFSDYSNLDAALFHEDKEQAKEELLKLLQDRTYKDVLSRYKTGLDRPVTGDWTNEAKFVASLSPAGLKEYKKAQAERKQIYETLQAVARENNIYGYTGNKKPDSKADKARTQQILNQTP